MNGEEHEAHHQAQHTRGNPQVNEKGEAHRPPLPFALAKPELWSDR